MCFAKYSVKETTAMVCSTLFLSVFLAYLKQNKTLSSQNACGF